MKEKTGGCFNSISTCELLGVQQVPVAILANMTGWDARADVWAKKTVLTFFRAKLDCRVFRTLSSMETYHVFLLLLLFTLQHMATMGFPLYWHWVECFSFLRETHQSLRW